MRAIILAGLAALYAMAVAAYLHPAYGQAAQNCGPRDLVIMRLAEGYGEGRQSIGIAGNGMVVETFANLESGSWTLTVTRPDGVTCLVASGRGFERLHEAPVEGDPT